MAKIKNFGLITRFQVKMYGNLRNLTSRVVFSSIIFNSCNALVLDDMSTTKLRLLHKRLFGFTPDRLVALKFFR